MWIWKVIHFILAVLSTALTDLQQPVEENPSLPQFQGDLTYRLKVHRATAYTLLIEVPCQPLCSITNFEVMIKKTVNGAWEIPRTTNIHPEHENAYFINGLLPDTSYFLRGRLNPPGDITPVLEARTCPEKPPPVSHLRVADAGPGWLDLRWRPPQEDCASQFEYVSRYKADGSEYTPYRRYGYLPSRNDGYVRLRPVHPCPSWPKEFCLLFVDDVQPGKNHTVELQAHRMDGGNKESAPLQRIVAFADTRPFCADSDKGDNESRNGGPLYKKHKEKETVQQCFVVSVIAMFVFLFLAGFVLTAVRSMLLRTRVQETSQRRNSNDEEFVMNEENNQSTTCRSLELHIDELRSRMSSPPSYEEVVHLSPRTNENAIVR